MKPVRIIPRLDIKSENLVKGIRLEGLRVVGEPGGFARRYYAQGADELLFMDIYASLLRRDQFLDLIKRTAKEVFIPMTVGGGIRTIDDITNVLRAGGDKIAINTGAIKHPDFLNEAAERLGSQCIMLSIEAKRRGPLQWECLTDNGRETTGIDALSWVEEAVSRGAGEILVTSVDQEGTRNGYDIALLSEIRRRVSVPVIASGGAGTVEHVVTCAREADVDAISAAWIFHYDLLPIPRLKAGLAEAGIGMRLLPDVAVTA